MAGLAVLAAALLAAAAAETRVVVEDFSTKAGLWTDTGQVLGLPESIQPPVGKTSLGRGRTGAATTCPTVTRPSSARGACARCRASGTRRREV